MGKVVFELYNADGSLQLDMTSRLTKVLGYITVMSNSSGSIPVDNLEIGTPWYAAVLESANWARGGICPTVVFTGDRLVWTRNPQASQPEPCTITYGIYSNGPN